jgi:hypothetical protein
MKHYVSLSLTNRKSSVHLRGLYSPQTAVRTFTPRRDQLMICGQYLLKIHFNIIFLSVRKTPKWSCPFTMLDYF